MSVPGALKCPKVHAPAWFSLKCGAGDNDLSTPVHNSPSRAHARYWVDEEERQIVAGLCLRIVFPPVDRRAKKSVRRMRKSSLDFGLRALPCPRLVSQMPAV